jgi:tetratricopeptide (TPR) repeat protein
MLAPMVAEREGEASSRDHGVANALARARPGELDGALVRSHVLASLFGKRVEAPRFGRFELRERIGQGGMGVVYRAWDPQLERAVAIKLVDTAGLDPTARERALREARSLAKLAHPNVITVYEAGLSDDHVWIAMEYVPGATLRDWLARTPRPDHQLILRTWIAVGRGLVAVHEAGLVHRDVKPSNVLMGDDGRPRLIDFGLVRGPQIGEEPPSRSTDLADTLVSRSAGTRGFAGTQAYAAPEQLEGAQVGAAADQYAFCVSVWESLCNVRPAPPSQRVNTSLVLPEGVALPSRVHRALSRGLAEHPDARFASLQELLDELEVVVEGPSRRLGLLFGAAALGAMVAGIAVTQLRAPTELPQVCVVDPRALDGTWDEPRRAALRERMAASQLDFAATSFATLADGLDQWSTAWLEARQAACAATQIAGVQSEAALDLRNACLERKRRALQVTLDTLLAQSEARELATRAPELLETLPRIGDCADPERLAELEPLPVDEQQRQAISRGYDVLAQAHALTATGALERADASTREFAAAHPEALSHAPLRLELEAVPARLELIRGRPQLGVPELVALAREAEARRLDDLAASFLSEAAEHAAGKWSKPELERWLLDNAEAALRRLNRSNDIRSVSLLAAEAALLTDAGHFEDALERYAAARALAVQLGDDLQAEEQRGNVAEALGRLGRFDEAEQTLTAGLEHARARWGASAPTVGHYEYDLAVLALKTGDLEAAKLRLDRAEAIFGAAFGPDSFRVARVAFARAKLSMIAGDFANALLLVDGAIEIYARELGLEHSWLAELHEARGVLRYFTGDFSGSIVDYENALRIYERVFAPNHPSLALLHSNIGESQMALGELESARASFDRALSIQAQSLPPDHPDLALPLKGRGQVALALGRSAEAVDDLERALSLRLESGGEPLELADLRFSLAKAATAHERKKSARAKLLAQQARADFEARDMGERVAEIDAWLAR